MKLVSLLMILAVMVGPPLAFGCGKVQPLTPSDEKHIERHGEKLGDCQNIGRDAGSYRVYEDCTKEAGLR